MSADSLLLPCTGTCCLEREAPLISPLVGGSPPLLSLPRQMLRIKEAANVSRTPSSFWQFIKIQVILKLFRIG